MSSTDAVSAVTLALLERAFSAEDGVRSLVDLLPVAVIGADHDGQITYANPAWADLTGHPVDDAVGTSVMESVHADDRTALRAAISELGPDQGGLEARYRVVTAAGGSRWVQARALIVRHPAGRVTGSIMALTDITELVDAEEESSRLAAIVESTSDLVGVVDGSGSITYLNRASRELFGLVDTPLAEIDAGSLYDDASRLQIATDVIPAIERDGRWAGQLTMRQPDGHLIQIHHSIVGELAAGGGIVRLSAVGRDVSDRSRIEAELAHQATHDPLTGLPNRALLLNHLDMALARSARDQRLVALLFVDLDRFKSVNDNRGHDAGDELLRQVAQRVSAVLRPSDTVARLGGDEFVVLFDGVDDEQHALQVGKRVCNAIEEGSFALPHVDVTITVSAGIAVAARAESSEALLRDADAAMYRAKDAGRARLEIYDDAMRTQAADRLARAEHLGAAIEGGGIEGGRIDVHYQPWVNLRTGEVAGVEALARWNHNEDLRYPHEFIPLAEDTGLIVALGATVLHQACREAVRWETEIGPSAPPVHVNLSARQLAHGTLPRLVETALNDAGLRPGRLGLEITESVLMDDGETTIDTLDELKALGVKLAIDDFGTGYSSLGYLRRFPVDMLKVDRSFIDGLGPDPEDSAVAAAIVRLAHTLELEAIAEGVETVEQLSELRALGCDAAQGYLFARPQPAESITTYLTRSFAV